MKYFHPYLSLDYLHLDDPKLSGVRKSVKATPKSMGSVIQRNRRSCETAYSPMIRRKDLPKLSADLGKDKKTDNLSSQTNDVILSLSDILYAVLLFIRKR